MAKLDEIAALLTEELYTFEQSVKKLEAQQARLKDFKLEPNLVKFEQLMYKYREEQRTELNIMKQQLRELDCSVSKAKLLPKWQIRLFWVLFTSSILGWATMLIVYLMGQ